MKIMSTPPVQQRIHALRVQALNKLTRYLLVSVFFFVLILLHRLSDADWQDIYLLHFISLFFAGLATTCSKWLSYNAIVYSYLCIGLTTAAVEFFSIGSVGIGETTSLFCIMLTLFFLDKRSTAVVVLIVLTIYCISYYQFVFMGKTLSDNDLTFLSWHSAWLGIFVGSAAFFIIIGMSIYYLQSQIIHLLLEVEDQKRTIELQHDRIKHLANYDALTGLPSLRLADDRLESVLKIAKQKEHQSALLFMDLDGFKAINDTYGHEAGDQVLKRVASRIVSIIRSGDTACRVGGDEFLVIVEKIQDLKDVESLCERLIKSISAPLLYKDIELTVGVSIGAAAYPTGAKSPKGLRLKADELMYQVKRSGKNNYRILMDSGLRGEMPLFEGL